MLWWPLRRWILAIAFATGVVVPVILLIAVDSSVDGTGYATSHRDDRRGSMRTSVGDSFQDLAQLREQVSELENIKLSLRNELLVLEDKRSRLLSEQQRKKDNTEAAPRRTDPLGGGEGGDGDTDTVDDREPKLTSKRVPDCPPTQPIQPAAIFILPPKEHAPVVTEVGAGGRAGGCSFSTCFDYSRCPLTRSFTVYVYDRPAFGRLSFNDGIAQKLLNVLGASLSKNPGEACLLFVPLDLSATNMVGLREGLRALPHWEPEGANHVIVSTNAPRDLNVSDVVKAIVVSGVLNVKRHFRAGHDILVPAESVQEVGGSVVPAILPESRPTLLYFSGELAGGGSLPRGSYVDAMMLETLREALGRTESVSIETVCRGGGGPRPNHGEWRVCGDPTARYRNYSLSLFSLVVPGGGETVGVATFLRLIEALRCGSIPVVVGLPTLPMSEVIEWGKAVINVPLGRFSEIHYILRNFPSTMITRFRLQGQFLWHSYFGTSTSMLRAVLALLRERTGHPPPLAADAKAKTLTLSLAVADRKEHTKPSVHVTSDGTVYTAPLIVAHMADVWNWSPGPFYMYSVNPMGPVPLSGVQFVGVPLPSFLPPHIVQAGGITGPDFEEYLLGNSPVEYFTIVILTYQRNDILMQTLKGCQGLKYLAKIVVIWNNMEDASSVQWPEIGVSIDVVTVGVNSLNNRFLPLSNIQTEAVLSIDDDVYLRHDEIQFGFRVWRENRDRIVGFPARFHSWDVRFGGWLYNSNYTCEFSMILTGAAFYHKYYSYLYSYWLSQEIRDIVDSYMNCEDIAMNFLVSHITRKPPIKVTSRWTFRCPGCPETLSKVETHFDERHLCLNRFASEFGYMPLLFSQYRADSVLFKTKLPSNLHKCYEYI